MLGKRPAHRPETPAHARPVQQPESLNPFWSPCSRRLYRGAPGTAKPQARFLLQGRAAMSSPVQASHSLRVFLAIVIAVAVLRYAQEVFLPLALAILLTFLLASLVDRLQRIHINRTV